MSSNWKNFLLAKKTFLQNMDTLFDRAFYDVHFLKKTMACK